MHYIFYETGNDIFFSHIADAFCSAVVKYIAGRYQEFVQAGGGIIDQNAIKAFLEKNRNMINPLNCALLCDCGDRQCRNNHKAVLASDQMERYSQSIKDAIVAFYMNPAFAKTSRERIVLQELFQNYFAASERGIKQIYILSKNNAIEYKKNNPRIYMSKYVVGVRKMLDKEVDASADNFVYIRSQTNSHFDYFAQKTGLPNLKPCDFLG